MFSKYYVIFLSQTYNLDGFRRIFAIKSTGFSKKKMILVKLSIVCCIFRIM